jgi:hypothetical protein
MTYGTSVFSSCQGVKSETEEALRLSIKCTKLGQLVYVYIDNIPVQRSPNV